MKRRARVDRLSSLIAPTTRLFWGLALMCSLLFLTSWPRKALLGLMGLILAIISGKRINFLYFLFLIITVVFFHLLLPFGKVIIQWGPLVITEGALKEGLNKGTTLCTLVFLSLFSVSKHLRLPGRFGQIWALTFEFYEKLIEEKKSLRLGHFFLSLDKLLERLFPSHIQSSEIDSVLQEQKKTALLGWAIIFLSLVILILIILSGPYEQ